MQRTILTLCLLLLLLVPIIAQEEDSNLDTIIGMTVPEAEALINIAGYELDPIILSSDAGSNPLNTITQYTVDDENTLVQVTVQRAYNVELIWENTEAFATQGGLRNLDGDELFTLVNLSDELLSPFNLQIGTFDSSVWNAALPAGWCAQIWTFAETDGVQLPECRRVQGGSLTSLASEAEAFWQTNDSFDVHQNGIYRGTCETANGRCQLWLSPLDIAEDIATYLYMSYDNSQFIVYNNSENLWMDISHLEITDGLALSEPRNWDETIRADLSRLAPNQCVHFTRNAEDELLIDCDVIATQVIRQSDIFWRSEFSIQDTLNGSETHTCPAASGSETVCLLNR